MLSLISSGALALPLMGLTPAAGSGWQVWQQIGPERFTRVEPKT